MATESIVLEERAVFVPQVAAPDDRNASGVTWSAVFGGATVTAALALVLLALGVGFGLSVVSPWSGRGVSATTLGVSAIAWLVVTQIIAAGFGGYLAGRLRTKWTRVHTDEVYFRDTAHGFLSWSVAAIGGAAILASASAMLAGARPASSPNSRDDSPAAYYVDALFRGSRPLPGLEPDAQKAEAARILERSLTRDAMDAADRTYLTQLVAARTASNESDAGRQLDTVMNQARADVDAARKVAARASLWTFLALVLGAWVSSYCATIGGRQRDHVVTPARMQESA